MGHLIFATAVLGGIWFPTLTAFAVLSAGVFNGSRIAFAFYRSSIQSGNDFGHVAASEVLQLVITLAFAVFALFGVLPDISEADQMRMRVVMGYAAAWSTHNFWRRHHSR